MVNRWMLLRVTEKFYCAFFVFRMTVRLLKVGLKGRTGIFKKISPTFRGGDILAS